MRLVYARRQRAVDNGDVMMGKGVILVWSNPESPEKEAEYNTWYNGIHIDELCAGTGCHRVTRHKVSDSTQMPGAGKSPYKYLAIYEFEDLAAGFAKIAAVQITPGPIDPDTRITVFDGVFDFAR
jgi:hypothetical protein